jgi:hypothetical protein
MSALAKAATMVSAKGAVGLGVALLALGAAGVATETAVTGSTNPANWGQQVVEQVQDCKAALTPGSHGIGQCVSAFAKQHGKQVSADHRASAARQNGSGHTPGPPSTQGKPTNAPGGKPSSVPGGQPSTVPPTGKP